MENYLFSLTFRGKFVGVEIDLNFQLISIFIYCGTEKLYYDTLNETEYCMD